MALVTKTLTRFAVLALAPALWAQNGSVEGRILNTATGAGIGGVKIRLLDSQRTVLTAVTDDTGVFRIDRLKDGQYEISYDKDGYLRTRPGPAESMIRVSGGGTARFDVEMATFPTLRGRVLDAEGKPAAGVAVQAGAGYSVATDADGVFVFSKLQPGRYTLAARPKLPVRKEAASPQEGRVEPVPTFYPSTIDRAQAESIPVRGGEDLSGYEIRMQTAPVQRIRGTVLNLAGKPLAKAPVTLTIPPSAPPFLVRGAALLTAPAVFVEQAVVTGADGSFEFASVRRGDWQIRVTAAPELDPRRKVIIPHYGSAAVSVGRRDIDDLTISLAVSFLLDVTANWGQGNPRSNPYAMLQLFPLDGQMSVGVVLGGALEAYPGRSVPWSPTSVPGYYPAAIMMGGRDVQGQEVNITAPQPIQVVYKSDGGTVRGTIDKGENLMVVLIPTETSSLKIGISAKVGSGGAFSIADVPPGDYYAAALSDTNGIATAEFQRYLAANGTRLRVEPGLSVSVDLRPARWP